MKEKTLRFFVPLLACVCTCGFAVAQTANDDGRKKKDDDKAKAVQKAKPSPTPEPVPLDCEVITIRTSNKDNRDMPVVIRRPKGYEAGAVREVYRVLLLVPFVPESGLACLRRATIYTQLADAKDWFILSPTFVQPLTEKDDRKTSYYFPEEWSGKAILEALEYARKKYPIDTSNLLVTGLSGGAKFGQRFGLWASDRVVAVAINSSGTFDDPDERAKSVAWILTIGEADPILPATLEHTAKLNRLGANPVMRSWLGMLHEDDKRANAISGEFLSHYDEVTKANLGNPKKAQLPEATEMPYVGDSRDGIYYANDKEALDVIPVENRIFLPSEKIAGLWGKPGDF